MTEFVSGNIFVRPNLLARAGDVTQGHEHNFDHTTICLRGAIRVEVASGEQAGACVVVIEGTHLLIRAGVRHEITALMDDTLYWCVYSHRTPDGEVSQVDTGWREAVV